MPSHAAPRHFLDIHDLDARTLRRIVDMAHEMKKAGRRTPAHLRPADIAERVRLCLQHAPADRLAFAPDCGLSQTARWAAKRKLQAMVAGVSEVRVKL